MAEKKPIASALQDSTNAILAQLFSPTKEDTKSAEDTPKARKTQHTQNIKNRQDTQKKRRGRPPKPIEETRGERLNLRLPKDVKDYLRAAAYRASNETHIVSVTEYLCGLVYDDMQRKEKARGGTDGERENNHTI